MHDADFIINIEDQEEQQKRNLESSFQKVKLFGLDILLISDSVYGLAYLTENGKSGD